MPERPEASELGPSWPESRTQLSRQQNFRQFLGSHVLNETGAAATQVVLPLTAVLALGASAWEMGLLQAANYAAYLVLGLPAGAWVERMRPRRVMISADLVRFVALLSLPLAWAAGLLSLPLIYLVALLLGTAQLFGDIADHTYLPHLTGGSGLIEGNSRLQLVRSGSELGGPGVGGLCVQWLGAQAALIANAAASALSAVLLWRIALPDADPAPARGGLAGQIGQGVTFLLRHRVLRALALSASLNNLVFSAIFALDVVFLTTVVGLPSGAVGILLASGAAGALLGARIAPRLSRAFGGARVALFAVPAAAPWVFLIPLTGNGWMVALFALGHVAIAVGVTVFDIMQVSYRQRACPPHLLSRMTAMFRFAVWGAAPLGAVFGGALAELLGVRTALWSLATALLIVSPVLLLSPLRRMREFDDGS
ncbi:MFS transporter [Saccharopolyspora erythraea]|uniref:MFS transporter n=1 Tax=Saccharopolyspora erythraea TaxID=1836 RepID=UPI001BABFB69|nr:MFS transporter [Saccharopolyspora erythraea]QUH01889.1 MFS transporter [Saccharopolyspora erythraea]